MMQLVINGNNYHYSFEQLLRVFMPDIKLEKLYNTTPAQQCDYVLCNSRQQEDVIDITVHMHIGSFDKIGQQAVRGEDLYKAGELKACQILYSFLQEYSNYTPQWGIQTGVRPTKIYFNLLRNNTSAQAVQYLEDALYISDAKVKLLKEVCENEADIIASARENEFSLYISIPFCPSRCSYCSFISQAYDSIKKLIPQYVELLCKELNEIARLTKESSLQLRTVYIGGGTPTVLDIEHLSKIFETLQERFDLSTVSEFTLEAGRPDTLTPEKLKYLKTTPVTRITINAQSFNDAVLQRIGRNHTAQDVRDAYALARKCGFDTINTDLIAGLEGESEESFLHSVQCAIDLKAENITIHTLALKRSSFLITRDEKKGKIISVTSSMIDKANALLSESGYIPYYMYRQSKSVGNLENTGWALPTKTCEYNVFMMEEVQDVFGAGAGAVTRLVNPGEGEIKRIFNYKYPYEYIADFEQILLRKSQAADMIKKWQKP